MTKRFTKALALTSSVVMAGSSFTGCGKNNVVPDGTEYIHKYTANEEKYCLGAKRGSKKIEGKTGKITINDDKADLDNFLFMGFLYTYGTGTVEKVDGDQITIDLDLGTTNTCAATLIGPLPKTSTEIEVPIDIEQSVYVKFKTK